RLGRGSRSGEALVQPLERARVRERKGDETRRAIGAFSDHQVALPAREHVAAVVRARAAGSKQALVEAREALRVAARQMQVVQPCGRALLQRIHRPFQSALMPEALMILPQRSYSARTSCASACGEPVATSMPCAASRPLMSAPFSSCAMSA